MQDQLSSDQKLIQENTRLRQKIRELEYTVAQLTLAERALGEREEKYGQAFHTNQDSISINRLSDGRYVEVNEGHTKLMQYEEAEIIGKTSVEINVWDDQADRERFVEELRRKGRVENFEAKFRKKDGSKFIGLMSASMINLDHVAHSLNVTKDISDRKSAEEALRKSEEKYRVLVENAIEAIYIAQDGKLTFANSETEKLMGYPKRELTSRHFTDFIHPQDRKLVMDRHKDRQQGVEVPSRYSFRLLRSSGETLWVELTVVRVEWNGRPATLNFLSDISSRKAAEADLERSHAFIGNVDDTCWEMDLSGNLIFHNEAFLKATGYSYDEYMALARWDRHPTREEAKRVFKIYESVRQTGIPAIGVEIPVLRKDGGIRISEMSIYLMRDQAGNPVGFRGIGRDVTALKRQGEETKRLEERLQRAEKMEALGTLAGGVAHDLNNVLGIIVGYAEMLLYDAEKNSPLRPRLVKIMDGGQRAAAIVQDLLTLARRGVFRRQALNLNQIITECLQSPEIEKLCSYHSAVTIKDELEPDLLNISGSSVHLDKTLFNLISNASEAMSRGGVVTIRTANQYLDKPVHGYDHIQEGDYVVLTVCDTGEGIPRADLKRIFEPFYTKKVMGRSGTGLGLAVVSGNGQRSQRVH